MIAIDLETLLQPVSSEEPCGPNLDEEAAFNALVDAARCLPKERIVGPNDASEEPNWQELVSTASSLFTRTKDLRIAAALAKAQLRLSGIVGYAACVRLVRELLDRHWDHVHPIVDPSDGDATMRLNALRELSDRQSVLLPLRRVPLIELPTLGSFSFKDISAAHDAAKSGNADALHKKTEAALNHCDTSHLQQLTAALQQTLSDLTGIERGVSDRLDAQRPLGMQELTAQLDHMHQLLTARLSARTAGTDPPASTDREGDMTLDGLTLQTHTAPTALRSDGLPAIRSRSDVQRALDLLCAYYEHNEPSSPVPILLQRARRLCTMSFAEIVRDLTPAGSAELEMIRGPRGGDNA